MILWPFVVLAGLAVGISMGLYWVSGSSVATPVLSLLGAPGFIAVASPLPATIPAAMAGAVPYSRSGEMRWRAAGWSLVGAVPGTVVGALLSRVAGGPTLLLLSGVVLVVAGIRVLLPIAPETREAGARRRQNRPLLVAATAALGVFTGVD